MLISAPSGEGIPPSSSSALIFGRQRSVTATLTYCVSSRARSDELLELFWRRMPGGILYHAFSPAAVPRLFSPQATTGIVAIAPVGAFHRRYPYCTVL